MHYVTWLGLWLKVKCLHREEFVVVGWTDPEGRRPWLGALLLAYYDPGGRLVYAGRARTGIKQVELERLWRRLQPLATAEMLRPTLQMREVKTCEAPHSLEILSWYGSRKGCRLFRSVD